MKERRAIIAAAVVAAATLLTASPVYAGDAIGTFARMSWQDKVQSMQRTGAHYYRDCTAVLTGQPGQTKCMHMLAYTDPNGSAVLLKASIGGTMRQWCVISGTTEHCYDQNTGAHTLFIKLSDGYWHSVN